MSSSVEEPLSGGAQASGVVRVGTTVRRPQHARSGFVQAVLRHLESAGFSGAPRALGFDDRGREMVTFVEGQVPHDLPFRLNDAQLRSSTDLVRAFHDATQTSALRADREVICHGDLGPHNTVFQGNTAVAIIDWDADVAPGQRIDDFAHAVWCCADLTEDTVPVSEQARKLHLMCRAYPGMTPAAVIAALTTRFHRACTQHAAAGRDEAVRVFEHLIDWMHINESALLAP